MSLRERNTQLTELMDDPACDPERLAATYRRFGAVNRVVSGWGTMYKAFLGPFLRGLGRPARVLDLGCGGGDVVARLAAFAEKDALSVEWTGADPDPRAHAAALASGARGVRFVRADACELLSRGEVFDVVLSNHVVHHLPGEGLRRFVEDSRMLATGIVMHSDIERSRLAYGLYGVGVLPLAAGTFLFTDGLRSIRRSYRADELADALGQDWRVFRPTPFRLLAAATGRA
jgi:2-polyprenyl-3-methyl-5-hydroxy-6-metoxy-1,4-benzoquinol methylase